MQLPQEQATNHSNVHLRQKNINHAYITAFSNGLPTMASIKASNTS